MRRRQVCLIYHSVGVWRIISAPSPDIADSIQSQNMAELQWTSSRFMSPWRFFGYRSAHSVSYVPVILFTLSKSVPVIRAYCSVLSR